MSTKGEKEAALEALMRATIPDALPPGAIDPDDQRLREELALMGVEQAPEVTIEPADAAIYTAMEQAAIGSDADRKLTEAKRHIRNLLTLIAGKNGNHLPMEGWCSFCDHGWGPCLCVCHAAREFIDGVSEQ